MSLASEYKRVLELIAAWPADQRISIAQEILSTIRDRPPVPRKTADRAYGLLRGPQPPPDDDDVKRILHEHRMEKYGR
jgi:hypothetical protein